MKALRAKHVPQTSQARRSPAAAGPTVASDDLSVRAARADDVGGYSEVALLHRYLEAEFSEPASPRRLPLAVSFPIIAILSAGLWIGLAAGARALLGG